jgi:hypothetical protein
MKTEYTTLKKLSLMSYTLIGLTLSSFGQANGEKPKKISDDTTKIKIGNITIIVDNGDSTSTDDDFDFNNEKEEEKEKSFELMGMMNIGMNGWLTGNNQTAFPSQYTNMSLNYSKSRLFGFDFMLSGLDLFKKHVYISPGLGISWNNYHFNEKIQISTGPDTTMFVSDSITNFTKYKFRNTYLSVPLVVGFRIGNVEKKHFDIHAGVIGSFNAGSIVKQKYTTDGTNNKDKIKDDFNVNPFKLEAIARLTFGSFGIYGKYSLTEQFQPNKTQEVYPFSVGVTFGNIGGN